MRRELKTRTKKEVAHLLRHQRSKDDPGGGKPLAPSHLYIASSIGAIYARCPLHVCSKLHNLEISRDHDGRSTAPTPGVKAWEPKSGTGLPNVVRRSADRERCPKGFEISRLFF